jgi:hypothetical protein
MGDVERWEEHRELRDEILGNTRPLGPRESHTTMRDPGFGEPLSHHDRKVSGVPTLVASDARSAEESRDFWWNNSSHLGPSPDRKGPSKPDVSPTSQTPSPSPPQATIEISPGVHVRLRGADETWKAIANDFYMPAECVCCESMIFCIQNADYILCPDCRVVSRMEDPSSPCGVGDVGGVGLGFKYEDLARWQEDILRDQ